MRRAVIGVVALTGVAIVMAGTLLQDQVASARSLAQSVLVSNTAAQRVPVAPPVWQGTPYVETRLLINQDFFNCTDFPTVPDGQVLYITRAVTSFNVQPGGVGSAEVKFQPLGVGSETSVDIPESPGSPAAQVSGNFDGYAGAVEIGQPATGTPRGCFATLDSDLNGEITILGFLVPAS